MTHEQLERELRKLDQANADLYKLQELKQIELQRLTELVREKEGELFLKKNHEQIGKQWLIVTNFVLFIVILAIIAWIVVNRKFY